MSCLLVDCETINGAEASDVVNRKIWTQVYMLVATRSCSGLKFSIEAMEQMPTICVLRVPKRIDRFSYACGVLRESKVDHWIMTREDTSKKSLKALCSTLSARSLQRVEDLDDEEESSDTTDAAEEEDEDKVSDAAKPTEANHVMMKSVVDFMGTTSGQTLIANVLGGLGGAVGTDGVVPR